MDLGLTAPVSLEKLKSTTYSQLLYEKDKLLIGPKIISDEDVVEINGIDDLQERMGVAENALKGLCKKGPSKDSKNEHDVQPEPNAF